MASRPIVLIHGYSASGGVFGRWRQILRERGVDAGAVHVLTYKSLTNEVSLDDIAEGFDRALRLQAGLDADEDFDAIVHSTGMLVVRAWLARAGTRRARLRHLIGLAPATFGSPLAHKGRGWLGAMFLGNLEKGPDFREAGDRILDGLELGSRYTWELAHRDLIGETPFYGETRTTPFVFVFCGTARYPFPLSLISEPGTDGTVRLAGAALNTRKILLDLTTRPGAAPAARVVAAPWSNADIPLVPIAGLDHGTILSEPSEALIELVIDALAVKSRATFSAWLERARAHAERVLEREPALGRWQQLVFRLLDERDKPITDYFIDPIAKPEGASAWASLKDLYPKLRMDVHVYGGDRSLRCFHLDLDTFDLAGARLGLRLIASSGTELVGYQGYREGLLADEEASRWDGVIDLGALDPRVAFFHPFTTTLVEIRLDREPLPLAGFNELAFFPDAPGRQALQKAEALAEALRKRERDEARIEELMAVFVAQSKQDKGE